MTDRRMANPLVTTEWLQSNLGHEKLVLIDASMDNVVGKEPIVYDQPVYIPGSQHIDLEGALCNLDSPQIHAFPTVAQFSSEATRLGLESDSLVVLYDNQGIYSAPRAWWIFRAMGIENVFVLDGGLPQWLAENRETVADLKPGGHHAVAATGNYQAEMVCGSDYVRAHLDDDSVRVVDARSSARFLAQAPEPRPGVRGGHIPNSLNLPFLEVLEGHRFKDLDKLASIFSTLLDKTPRHLVFSCGSGITACIILLAAVIAGYDNLTLYDGSWADWGSDESLPIQ
ncbi:sulfurtransferase [Marinobacter zhejiangensis]|uniref:Thiosulfate/3-mercaptopyruvate sulfurtransferase n=1 Tax=Marinobacter zhejiangensis TaxID=488535 RepID=A0A1I4NE60_9GAMM|nr:sulfurtransferase [Marinobacter zhejiangensis]SFM13493.1 thiosulfate/3-mercaptopyruvate sulfurtransferase [Marinobacter zhejiangensis]